MKPTLSQLPEWQRERAQKLNDICEFIEGESGGKMAAMKRAVTLFDGVMLKNGAKPAKSLRISVPTLRRAYDIWINASRTAEAFVLEYTTPGRKVPSGLILEWQTRLSKPGVNHDGRKSARTVYKALIGEWKGGFNIPGVGTWQEFWTLHHKDQPQPKHAPEFPFAYKTLLRYRPDPATAALGNKGIAAARAALNKITRDSSELRACELFVLDDVKMDEVVMDDTSHPMKLVEPTLYLMMEVGSRFICGFVTRGTESVLKADVDALIAHVLGQIGIGRNYATHILFERGALACSDARQKFLEAQFPGRLFIHRTGMNSGRAIAGGYLDKASGRPASKGMIESFMRKLHLRLHALPGQTGASQRYDAPAELDARKQESETLAAIHEQTGAAVKFGILTLSTFNLIVRQAINDYNRDADHDCQGFHTVAQAQIQPGVWHDVPMIEVQPEREIVNAIV